MDARESPGPDRDPDDPQAEFARRCDAIEAGYEFMLAYAAQGLSTDPGPGGASEIREYLRRVDAALAGLPDCLARVTQRLRLESVEYRDFLEVFARDAQAMQGALRLVLAQPALGSPLIDNLNASLHLRTLLTDLFLIDEILKHYAA